MSERQLLPRFRLTLMKKKEIFYGAWNRLSLRSSVSWFFLSDNAHTHTNTSTIIHTHNAIRARARIEKLRDSQKLVERDVTKIGRISWPKLAPSWFYVKKWVRQFRRQPLCLFELIGFILISLLAALISDSGSNPEFSRWNTKLTIRDSIRLQGHWTCTSGFAIQIKKREKNQEKKTRNERITPSKAIRCGSLWFLSRLRMDGETYL